MHLKWTKLMKRRQLCVLLNTLENTSNSINKWEKDHMSGPDDGGFLYVCMRSLLFTNA